MKIHSVCVFLFTVFILYFPYYSTALTRGQTFLRDDFIYELRARQTLVSCLIAKKSLSDFVKLAPIPNFFEIIYLNSVFLRMFDKLLVNYQLNKQESLEDLIKSINSILNDLGSAYKQSNKHFTFFITKENITYDIPDFYNIIILICKVINKHKLGANVSCVKCFDKNIKKELYFKPSNYELVGIRPEKRPQPLMQNEHDQKFGLDGAFKKELKEVNLYYINPLSIGIELY